MLAREAAEAALQELAAELGQRGHKSKIYIVGGAALMLGFGARDATNDIGAVITPRAEIMTLRRRRPPTKPHGRLVEFSGSDVRACLAR